MREKVSVCITAGNEEKNIRRCLNSVKWADEIIVVDSFSTDRTVEICKEYTNRVYSHRWLGYIGQKNLIKDLADGPWILFIDADEEISKDLHNEIISELESDTCKQIAGYEFTRLVKFLDRWITHGDWYPDIKLRLFRKDKGHCGGKEPHDKTTVDGAVKHLRSDMYHYTYDKISDQLETLNRFSSISANGHYSDNRSFYMHDLLMRPIIRFIRSYILRRGFMDGLPGFIIAITCSYGVFVKYAKLWEKSLPKKKTED